MELTVTNLVFILAGVFALAISVLLYMFFSGGIQTNIDMLLGVFG